MGKRRQTLGMVGLALVVTLVAASCGGAAEAPAPAAPSGPATPQKGGVYRSSLANFDFTDAFDPTGEYLGFAWTLYGAMLRSLVNYKHVAGAEGNKVYPDLATAIPEPTDGGLTWTFKLKPNIKFGPPLDRAITSKDIAYAFERMNAARLAAGYAFYYTAIKGFTGKAKAVAPVEGVETPDDSTIVFRLTKPVGDFLYRLAMPATSPIPREVASCFDTKTAGAYGRYVISTGPYMFKGADQLDASSCGTLKPISGYDPTKSMTLVRNPNYDQATDDLRGNFVDGIQITVNTNVDDIFAKVLQGELDGSLVDQPSKAALRQYATDPAKKDLLHSNSGDRLWYITMNTTTPPFDDVHVRKAANLVMDKAGVLRAWGGSAFGQIATHIMPPIMLNDQLKQDYDPYASPDFAGDVDKAKEEMKQSKYDSDKDGLCDGPKCSGLIMVNRSRAPWKDAEPVVVQSFEKIGIKVTARPLADHYPPVQTPKNNIPLGMNVGWGKDYADASTFAEALFLGTSLVPTNNTNYSLLGLTPENAKDIGVAYPAAGTPNVDADINTCLAIPTTDPARVTCWLNLDKKLMEEVVPVIPYLWSNVLTTTAPSVTKYEFDQFSAQISLTQIAVNNGLKP